jgi:hypothetical protein
MAREAAHDRVAPLGTPLPAINLTGDHHKARLHDGPGTPFDPAIDRIVAWVGGSSVLVFNSDTKTCATVAEIRAQRSGLDAIGWHAWPVPLHAGLDAFLLENDAETPAFIFKF